MIKKFFLITLVGTTLSGICNRKDREHVTNSVMRCLYTQEDIFRCYSKKVYCYGAVEDRKQCFFCGCPITEHSKQECDKTKYCRKKKRYFN